MTEPAGDLLQQVRDSCGRVAADARHVFVRRDRLAHLATVLQRELSEPNTSTPPGLDPSFHYLGHGAETVAFILILDAVNFGSGYFPKLKKRPGLSGYFTLAISLTEHVRRHGVPSAADLRDTTAADCLRVFQQDPANHDILELMGLFARAWHALGRFLLERFGGSFPALVQAAEGSAAALVGLLAEMPFFDDRQVYGDHWVHFYKRAQLTAADLALAVPDTPWGRFHDLERLTLFADNLVPHVLHMEGVLDYEPNLMHRIRSGTLIPPGAPEEVEIRACAVHAVERLKAELAAQGVAITAMALDHRLWTRGQSPSYKAVPRHRTRTVFY